MNFPQRAYSTFTKLKYFEEYSNIYNFVKRILSRIDSPVERARKTHQYVSNYTYEATSNPVAKKFITCHRGCSACCHTQVSVNKDEAELLAHRIIGDNLEIDLTKMYIQANVDNDSKKWFELPYELRGCVFLDKDGACTVYNDRPSVCRTNNVLSPPKMCETKDGVEKSIRLLNTEKADMAMIAGFEVSGEAGTLPLMLWKALKNYGENTGAGPKQNVSKYSKAQIKSILDDSHLAKVKKSLSKIFEV